MLGYVGTLCRDFTLNLVSGCVHCVRNLLNLKVRLHGSPRLINAVESTTLNSTVERYSLHSSTKVNEAVDFKMAANELVREGVVVICDCLIKVVRSSLLLNTIIRK